MKRTLFLSMLTFFCLVGGSAWAQTFTQGNLKYTVTDADAKTVSVAKASNDITGAITIPSSVTEGGVKYTVTETAAGAFHNCTGITAMTVPSSVKTVRRGFLTNCPALKKLTVNDSSTPLYFVNNWSEYTTGNDQLCVADLDYFYLGRDIEAVEGNKNIVTSVKEIKLGGKMTTIPGWFSDENKALTKVTIGGNITKIGQEAFDSNTSLATVTITAPVDTIYQSAFWGCTSLTKFDIPATVKYLGPAVFRNCTSLAALTIPAATEHITRGLITGCTGLKKLTIENSETPLFFENNWAAYTPGNNELAIASCLDEYYQGRDITVVDGGYKIVTSAKKIELGGSMTAIPTYFTQSDTALTTLIIGDNITKIGQSAFDSNTRLTSVTITAPVDTMLQSAFWGCTALESFEIPATVKYLGPAVFRNCTALEALTIPAATEHITRGLITGCTGLKKLTVENSDKPLYFENNWSAYTQGNYELAIASCLDEYYQGRDITVADGGSKIVTSAKKIELGGSMTAIPEHFTENDTALTTLIIGDNINKIGYVAFCRNTRLNSVTFNAPVDSICQSAFYECTALETIELPNTLKYLGPGTFFNCTALSALTIPAATEYVGRGILTNCTGLKSLSIEDSSTPLYFENNYSLYTTGTNELCRSDLDYFYMGRDVDRREPENILITSAKKIKVAGGVTALPGYFTKNNKALTEVLVQGDMTKIGYQAFYGCSSLTSATLDAPIDTVRYEAFYGCSALPTIELPEEMKRIEVAAFKECAALAAFTIPAATEYVGRGIFTNCSALKSLTIEDSSTPLFFENNYSLYTTGTNELCRSDLDYFYMGRDVDRIEPENILITSAKKIKVAGNVTALPGYFTKNNKALTEVLVQGDMTKIGYQAFYGCSSLTSATLDAPIDTIRYEAFYGCSALPTIEMPETVKRIEVAAFKECAALTAFTIPAATEYVGRGIFTNCSALKSLTIEDSSTPLYFENNYSVYTSGTNELCVADVLEDLYVGRNITLVDASRLVKTAQNLTFGQPVSDIGTLYNAVTGLAKVTVPWQAPLTITANAFSSATYNGATLRVPGGTLQAYKAATGWKNFVNMEESSFFVTGTATAGGTLTFAGETVTNGSKTMLIDRETDVVFKVSPEENYDFTSLTVNGAAVNVANNTYTYPNLQSNIEVVATFTEKPKFNIKATATGGTVSLNGATPSASQTIKVYRDTDVTLAIAANEGYENPKVTVNGTDVTAQVKNNQLKLENIQEAKTIVVTYSKIKFTVTKQATQNGTITLSKTTVEWGSSFTATFKPATGYELATATLNNKDVTAQVVNNVLTVTNVKENKTVGATFQKQTYTVSISGGGVSVSNMNPQYGDNVTVTIENDPDRTLVSLIVNGQDVTAQVVNGQYIIRNVSSDVTVEATFRSTKEFITLTSEYATFSCPQDLDFSGSNLHAYIASGFNKNTNQVLLTRVKDVPAGTGIFLIGTPGQTYKIPYAEASSIYMNFFQANLTKSTIYATAGNYSNYTFGEQDGDPGFYPIADRMTLLAQTAYLQLPSSFVAAGVKVSVVLEDDIIDGIEDFIISDTDTEIYDLAGRRLGKTQHGVNIINGKKVLVK